MPSMPSACLSLGQTKCAPLDECVRKLTKGTKAMKTVMVVITDLLGHHLQAIGMLQNIMLVIDGQ